MPAISFQGEWLDQLLSGTKQQTTRSQTDRFKVGDIVHIYNQQRRRIADKPERRLTRGGWMVMQSRYGMTPRQAHTDVFYAHFLGKVIVTGVYDIRPCEITEDALKAWARADGFKDFHPTVIPPDRLYDGANMWFQRRYGDDWMQQAWTVIRWNGWIERYFLADGEAP